MSTISSIWAFSITSGGDIAMASPDWRTIRPSSKALAKALYPRVPTGPSGARSMPQAMPRLRMSVTFGRPFSEWMPSSQYGDSSAARANSSSSR